MIPDQLRRFRYFKWLPRQITNVDPRFFTHLFPGFIIGLIIVFYLIELIAYPSSHMDSYNKQWDLFKNKKSWTLWRNEPPPLLTGIGLRDKDQDQEYMG